MALSKLAQIKIGDGAMSEAFTEITPITAATWDGAKVWENQDITPLSSSKAREFVSTLYTVGNVNFTLLPYNNATTNHALLKSHNDDGELHNFQVVLPASAGTYQVSGFVESMKPITDTGGVFGYEVTIKCSGEATSI